MRILTANAIAEIAKNLGTEPLNIIEIEWVSGSTSSYSDKEILGIPGKILQLSNFDNVLTLDKSNSAQISVVLDDIDGTIKTIIDGDDVHKRPCIIYQHFEGLNLNDKFILFKGQVSSPIVWNEGDRTVSFTIISQIEDKEVGFSPEEGQFDFVSEEAIGKPWPLVFGDVLYVPATKAREVLQGTLKDSFCIVDPTLQRKLDMLRFAYQAMQLVKSYFEAVIVGANLIAPPVAKILDQFIIKMKQEDALIIRLFNLMKEIEDAKKKKAKNFADESIIKIQNVIIFVKNQFIKNVIAPQLQVIQQQKQLLFEQGQLAKLEAQVKNEAFNKQVEALNEMVQIYGEYSETLNELCRQLKCVKESIGIVNGHKFPQGTLVSLIIKNILFKGVFDNDTFTFVNGPEAKYLNVPVGAHLATFDDCDVVDTFKGLGRFWITDNRINLKDTYCLVQTRVGKRHIIKINDQIGLEVHFELIRWDQSGSGGSNNFSGGGLIQSDVPLPTYGTPFGPVSVDPVASGLAPGNGFDICNTLTPDTQKKLKPSIPNQDEFNFLVSMQCLQPLDELSDALIFILPSPRDALTVIGEDIGLILESAGVPLAHWLTIDIPYEEIPEEISWFAEVGTTVYDAADLCEIYIANILPSEIKSVMAYRTVKDKRVLSAIPSYYYTKDEANNLGPITVTSLKFPVPLTSINEAWEDQVYVSLSSSVGSNVVDILEYLINTYSNGTVDSISFNDVRTKFGDLYPANFAIFDRKNVLTQLHEIAWQARCTVFEKNNIFYIKYLSEVPLPVATIIKNDIEISTLRMEYTETEDLVTKLIAKWKPNYLPIEEGREENKIILRHNVEKYGLHEQDYDFYIYNTPELVLKSATFWLIRYANTWKRLFFNTFLTRLELETLDAITMEFEEFSFSFTRAIIEKADYDSQTNTIALQLWLPIRAGEMEPYVFAWPANAGVTDEFPLSIDFAGGTGIGTSIVEVCL